MTHFVCTGDCGEESASPGTCTMQDCMKNHQSLSACHCKDGHHEEAYSSPNMTTED